MTTEGSSSVAISRLAAAAGAILLCLGCVFTRAQLQTQSTNSPTGGSLVVVEPEARDKTIQFGDDLAVLLTLQNNGKQAIRIPGGALLLKNRGWSGCFGGGSGLGESPLILAGAHGKEEFLLQPGESAALTGSNIVMASTKMGPMKADFV